MDSRQNPTNVKVQTSGNKPLVGYDALTYPQQKWVDYKAINGLVVDEDGIKKMTIVELAQILKVNRDTLYEWSKKIPNFWVMVQERRTELAGQNRLAKMHETWELKAMKGDWQFWNAWMINFGPGYKTPTTKVDVDVSHSWASLVASNEQTAIEGEVVNDGESNNV